MTNVVENHAESKSAAGSSGAWAIPAVVLDVRRGTALSEVRLRALRERELLAVGSSEVLEGLGVAPGVRVHAVIEPAALVLSLPRAADRVSYGNRWPARILRLRRAGVTSEVLLDMGSGASVAALISNESLDRLGLAEGSEAAALFDPGAVTLALRPGGTA